MALMAHPNFAFGLVANTPGLAGAAIVLSSGDGANFPDPASVGSYMAFLRTNSSVPSLASNTEKVLITAKAGDLLTATRGYLGSVTQFASPGYAIYVGPSDEIEKQGENWYTGAAGGQTFIGGSNTGETLTLKANAVDANTVAVQMILGPSRAAVYAPTPLAGVAGTMQLISTDAFAAGQGARLTLSGHYDGVATNYGQFAGIAGVKANASSGDYAGQLLFYTRVNGSGALSKAGMFDEGQRFAIGTQTPVVPLDVEGPALGVTFGKIGSSLPLYLIAANPTVGFNAYYDGNWRYGKGSTAHYGGFLGHSPNTGQYDFYSSSVTGAAGATFTAALSLCFSISRLGHVTIPGDPNLEQLATDGAGVVSKGYWGSMYDVFGHGAVGNGVTDDRAIIATGDATGIGLFFRGGHTYFIGSNLTINSICFFGQGAQLVVPTGVTVTINGEIYAGRARIFTLTGTAAIRFGTHISGADCEWFGAGQGVTDDLAACNACYAACVTNNVPIHLNTSLNACPSQSFTLSAPVALYCHPSVTISSTGAVNCFTMLPGVVLAIMFLPAIQGFTGAAIVCDATSGNIVANEFQGQRVTGCGQVIRLIGAFECNTMRFRFHNCASNTTIIKYEGSGLMQGNEFYFNFWNAFTYGMDFNSCAVGCQTDGTKCVVPSIDINHAGAGAIIRNNVTLMVRLTFDNHELSGSAITIDATFKILDGIFAACTFWFGPQFNAGVAAAGQFYDPSHWDTFVSGGGPNRMFWMGTNTYVVSVASSPYTIPFWMGMFEHLYVSVNATGGPITVNLPGPNNHDQQITVIKIDGTGNAVTCVPYAGYVFGKSGVGGIASYALTAIHQKATFLGINALGYHQILNAD